MTHPGKILLLILFLAGAFCATLRAAERKHLSYGWTVRAAYPETGDETIDADLALWLHNRLNDQLRTMTEIDIMPDLPEMNSEIDLDYSIARPGPRALSVVFKTYVYPARAAHGTTAVEVLNYDLRDKTALTLDDIFAKPDIAVAIMSRAAPGILLDYVKAALDDDDPSGGAAPDESVLFPDGFAPARDNFAALILEPGGVRVVFQQYQALPYSFGLPEAFYPLSMLAEAGPNNELWAGETPE